MGWRYNMDIRCLALRLYLSSQTYDIGGHINSQSFGPSTKRVNTGDQASESQPPCSDALHPVALYSRSRVEKGYLIFICLGTGYYGTYYLLTSLLQL